MTGVAAVLAATTMVPVADSGFFAPDPQQQLDGNLLLGWLLVSSVTLFGVAFLRQRAAARRHAMSTSSSIDSSK